MSGESDHPLHRWDQFRRQMPVTRKWAYLDHAAVAPLSQPAQEALVAWAAAAVTDGDTVWSQWSRRIEQVRQVAAKMVGAEPAEIALIHNTTEGICFVAQGYPWTRGDNVVTLADEFPSNLYPWLNLQSQGVETRRVPTDGGRVDLSALAAACNARTRIISVSWVGYASGWRNDLDAIAEIAHSNGALFFLDAIQALGVFPLDVNRTPIDFFAADGHKWMLGPEGAGLFYIRREHLDTLRPQGVGWNSVVHAHDFSRIELKLKDSAARYEGGSQNMAGFFALGASLDLLTGFGIDHIAQRILQITEMACERLKSIGAKIASSCQEEHRSGIVSFELPGTDPIRLHQRCLDAGVALSARDGRLRISPHAYNNEQDIERFIEVLLEMQ